MPHRTVVVATHGHCLDGLCSAALFTRLLRHVEHGDHGRSGDLVFRYLSMGYGPGDSGVPPRLLDGDVNAILDFRFSAAENLTWYFDHHVSAFATPGERRVFEERAAGGGPREPSATSTTAPTGRARSSSPTSARRSLGSTPRRSPSSCAGPT